MERETEEGAAHWGEMKGQGVWCRFHNLPKGRFSVRGKVVNGGRRKGERTNVSSNDWQSIEAAR